jgi:outer membrane protein insertion porin family
VRRIDVAGNTRTRDEVVRREFRQLESAWYDGNRIKLSRDRVDRLGYFKDVDVDTNEVAGAPDQVDLVVNVTEKPTGNLLIGAGYSNAEKLTLTASIKQDNVFGSGNYLGIEVNTSKSNRTLVLSTVDPYFTVDGISRRSICSTAPAAHQQPGRRPTSSHAGRVGALRRAVLRVRHRLRRHRCREHAHRHLHRHPEQLLPELPRAVRATACLAADAGLGARWPRQRAGAHGRPLPAGQLRVELCRRRALPAHQPAVPGVLAAALEDVPGRERRTRLGKGLGGKPYPGLQELLRRRPGHSVRAFEQGSLGVVDPTGAYIGGPRRFNLNAELYFPVPGTGNDRTLRIFAFADTGNVWREARRWTLAQPARLGRPGPELDLAGGARSS